MWSPKSLTFSRVFPKGCHVFLLGEDVIFVGRLEVGLDGVDIIPGG